MAVGDCCVLLGEAVWELERDGESRLGEHEPYQGSTGFVCSTVKELATISKIAAEAMRMKAMIKGS